MKARLDVCERCPHHEYFRGEHECLVDFPNVAPKFAIPDPSFEVPEQCPMILEHMMKKAEAEETKS